MDRDFDETDETLEMLRKAHREAIPEAHFAAVRARVLAQLAAERRPWWRGIWAYGFAAVAALLLVGFIVGRTPWSAQVPLDRPLARRNEPRVIPERPTRASAADQGVRPTNSVVRRKRLARNTVAPAAYRMIGPPTPRPLMVKLLTNDPDVVIYWFTGE